MREEEGFPPFEKTGAVTKRAPPNPLLCRKNVHIKPPAELIA